MRKIKKIEEEAKKWKDHYDTLLNGYTEFVKESKKKEQALREIAQKRRIYLDEYGYSEYSRGYNRCLSECWCIAARALPANEAQGESDDKAE